MSCPKWLGLNCPYSEYLSNDIFEIIYPGMVIQKFHNLSLGSFESFTIQVSLVLILLQNGPLCAFLGVCEWFQLTNLERDGL